MPVRLTEGNESLFWQLPTIKARDGNAEGYEAGLRRSQPQIGTLVKGIADGDSRVLMPTPMTRDYKGDTAPHERNGVVQTDTVERAIFHSGQVDLIGTPRTSSANAATQKQIDAGAPKSRIEDQVLTTNWGKFEPAIRRCEQLTRPAPSPTKPDGKNGNHRLSSLFVEWMMMLPAGWVTGHGLKRNDELKMLGNGVVPSQAALALRYLLQDVELEKATSES
jgi:DNA (cytosine-5)-methyltransferase 1